MAEINIQKKKSPIWPWLILMVVVIIAAWLLIDNVIEKDNEVAGGVKDELQDDEFLENDDHENEIRRDNLTSRNTSYASVMVNEYIVFINDKQPSGNTGNEEFIKEGVKKLGNALSAVVQAKYPGDAELNNKSEFIKQKSDSINQVNNSSGEIKEIFISTVEIMNSMKNRSKKNIDNEISKAKESAEKIKATQPAKNQQKEMIVFLKQSGDVLQVIAADEEINNNRY
jgi:hypothetical protein